MWGFPRYKSPTSRQLLYFYTWFLDYMYSMPKCNIATVITQWKVQWRSRHALKWHLKISCLDAGCDYKKIIICRLWNCTTFSTGVQFFIRKTRQGIIIWEWKSVKVSLCCHVVHLLQELGIYKIICCKTVLIKRCLCGGYYHFHRAILCDTST